MEHKHIHRINSVLFLGIAVFTILYLGASFIIPFLFAIFLATLVKPLTNILENIGLGKAFSALLSTLLVFVVVGGVAYIMISQIRVLGSDLPQIQQEVQRLFEKLQQRLSNNVGITRQEQSQFIEERSDMFLNYIEEQITFFLGNLFDTTLKFLLVLIYLFLLLLNRDKYERFVLMAVSEENQHDAKEIMYKTAQVSHQYLWGRLQVMGALALMYIITFWAFDLEYALLLTVFGALITIIPYIGPFLSGILPVLTIMLFGRDLSTVLTFAGVILVIQLIESYVLEPIIIGSEIRINPLTVIVAVVIGGMMWGMSGMILFVPMVAILKIFFDQTQNLRPAGYLIGTSQENPGKTLINKVQQLIKKVRTK